MRLLRLCRSLLFLPASNPRAIGKARTLDADMVILDCEDSVADEDKKAARQAAVAAADEGFGDRLVAIRINALGSAWHEADLAAAAASRADCLVLPKVESADQAVQVSAAGGKPLIAMIESAAGILESATIARASAALLAGTNDLAADLGIPSGAGRAGLAHALQAIVLGGRAAGIAVFDGVYNHLEDVEGLAAECHEGRAYGFDGKSVIHPSQIGTVNGLFDPSAEEIDQAQRLVAEARGGAQRFEGRMIEAMHVAEAEAVLAKGRGRGSA